MWRIIDTQCLQDVRQCIVLPANQYIAFFVVAIDKVLNAIWFVPVARRIHSETEVFSQRLNGIAGTGAFSICPFILALGLVYNTACQSRIGEGYNHTALRCLRHNMGDIIIGILAENFAKALCTLDSLCIQSSSSITGFLPVSNEVDCRRVCCRNRSNGQYTVRQKSEHDCPIIWG